MADYRFTEYFEKKVLAKRPYLTKELCIQVVEAPIRSEHQEALEDKVTIHNAFLDKRFKP